MDFKGIRINGHIQGSQPPYTPDVKNVQGRDQILSRRRENIFHFQGDSIILDALHQSVPGQFLQLLAQYFFTDTQGLLRLVETDLSIMVDMMKKRHFPFAGNAVGDIVIRIDCFHCGIRPPCADVPEY